MIPRSRSWQVVDGDGWWMTAYQSAGTGSTRVKVTMMTFFHLFKKKKNFKPLVLAMKILFTFLAMAQISPLWMSITRMGRYCHCDILLHIKRKHQRALKIPVCDYLTYHTPAKLFRGEFNHIPDLSPDHWQLKPKTTDSQENIFFPQLPIDHNSSRYFSHSTFEGLAIPLY